MNKEDQWINDAMTQVVWPDHSANLHSQIMAKIDLSIERENVIPFTRMKRPGLKISAIAVAAMIAGFCVGMIGQPVATSTNLAYNSASPYYTGSGMMMVGMLEDRR